MAQRTMGTSTSTKRNREEELQRGPLAEAPDDNMGCQTCVVATQSIPATQRWKDKLREEMELQLHKATSDIRGDSLVPPQRPRQAEVGRTLGIWTVAWEMYYIRRALHRSKELRVSHTDNQATT